jgi:hypothetical protein
MLHLMRYPWPLHYSMEIYFSTSAGIEPIVTSIVSKLNRERELN